jgi:preprotein translocase subunit SecD
MSPLVIMGFGTVKGFAIVTIIGVVIGVSVARPVYGVIIKELLEAKGEVEAQGEITKGNKGLAKAVPGKSK